MSKRRNAYVQEMQPKKKTEAQIKKKRAMDCVPVGSDESTLNFTTNTQI